VRLRDLWWVFCLTATAHGAAVLYDSPQGGFAFKAPAGWQIVKQPVEQYPVLFGPKDDPDGPYVVITEVRGAPDTDLFALGDGTLKEILKDSLYQLSIRDAFHTADGRIGIKYVLTTPMPNTSYRQVFYFVEGPGDRRFCFMATLPEAGWKNYAEPLDNMLKTYRLREGTAAPTVLADASPAAGSEMPAAPKAAAGNSTAVAANATASATGNTTVAKPAQLPARVAGK
jgi:hypothetical protein